MDPRERRSLPDPSGPPSQKALTTALRWIPTLVPPTKTHKNQKACGARLGEANKSKPLYYSPYPAQGNVL